MANTALFKTTRGHLIHPADTVNEAGGLAYRRSPELALAQYAVTGCFNHTYYVNAADQLQAVIELCSQADPEFLAKVALYARSRGFMKDMPAILCAELASKDTALLARIFPRVIDNGKMLRNFVQFIRSGVTGRKSLGSAPKRLVLEWLAAKSDDAILRNSVGNTPSLADVIKMVHPKPETASRRALYGYLLGKEHQREELPRLVTELEDFRAGRSGQVPQVPFELLTACELGREQWQAIARQSGWTVTRMNLNTFLRHGVFDDSEIVDLVAKRLADPQQVLAARAFPYQIMAAYLNASDALPAAIRAALHDALETATANVPELPGQTYVCIDVSGSMGSPITGSRPGATSKVRCVDVAALMAAAFLRRNPQTGVIAFNTAPVRCRLEPRDSVMTNARLMAGLLSGGTSVSSPIAELNRRQAKADLVVIVSDNESWADRYGCGYGYQRGTALMEEWEKFKRGNPRAKLVCLDITPSGSAQGYDRDDVMNVGGFSDQVFSVIEQFARSGGEGTWLAEIDKMTIE